MISEEGEEVEFIQEVVPSRARVSECRLLTRLLFLRFANVDGEQNALKLKCRNIISLLALELVWLEKDDPRVTRQKQIFLSSLQYSRFGNSIYFNDWVIGI